MSDRRGQLVKVIWNDTNGTARWTDQDYFSEQMKPARCESVGWIMADTKSHLSIAASHDDGGDNINDGNIFPRSCIVEVIPLVEKRKPKKTKDD